MSMTDFMALGDSWSIEARKLPAAPALWVCQFDPFAHGSRNSHHEVDASQLLCTPIRGCL